MLEDLLIAVITNAIVFYAGYRWGMHQAIMRLISNWLNDPEHLNKAFKELTRIHGELKDDNKAHIDVTAEWHGDNVYLYHKDTHEFMAQGTSIDEAMEQAILKKNTEYRIPEEMANKPTKS